MRRHRFVIALLAAFAIVAGSRLLLAAGPAVMLVYGGALPEPVVIVIRDLDSSHRFAALWCGRESSPIRSDHVGERPYLNIAMFWGLDVWSDPEHAEEVIAALTPADAAQHGRLYLPGPELSATVVTTGTPAPRPDPADSRRALYSSRKVPIQASDFAEGCFLSAVDNDALRGVGLPGL